VKLALTLAATPEQVMAGVEALQAFCRSAGIAEEATYALMVALEEASANILHHAYRDDPARSYRVLAALGPDGVEVEVRDDGPPFDPVAPRPPKPLPDPDDPPIGGLGITLIQRSVDEVRYAREGGENVLRLTKRIRSPS
jgi:serine/threonine-protein kinase RsbW